ncbi:mitochondrial 37S ribosomal protein uS4m Ecym_6374 [Eremothecium cymbalariae DBVPG|uniref:Small ribosomal subunit protein uS4m n=1 Tax=Eremothecium cymbalariae (strain CBS 270.75 / DBVPG 7215 / KCTC 17166 / NRRL Y-17582) TaxID=931890 RepID=G8JUG9_ERECY|nr:hypothetical protein Ecym_6374 [Eremothecium cymbalariae DBVPG\
MPRKALLLKSLARGKIRASFNKYNLFNLYKKSQVDFRSKTLYQQKWTAKQETRAYHGEHLTESRWQTTFSPQLSSVAQLDASLKGGSVQSTPILLQTYAVLEKRLDFALFRAMFASSIRQARQFILHGNVFVNGVKIKHPGYQLKPGDIFNVKAEKVLQALGTKKPSLEDALKVDKKQITLWNRYVTEARNNPREVWESKLKHIKGLPASRPEKQQFLEFIKHYNSQVEQEKLRVLKGSTKVSTLAKIISVGQAIPAEEAVTVASFESAFHGDKHLGQSAFEIYQALVGSKVLTKFQGSSVDDMAAAIIGYKKETDIDDPLKKTVRTVSQSLNEFQLKQDETFRKIYDDKKGNLATCELPYDPEWVNKLPLHPQINVLKLREDPAAAQKSINLLWQTGLFGRQNPSKPYFTPWKPRPFLAPFAILPHHLEISFKTCHAVYLRDPVARPGHSEVISPFGLPVHQRAYMYYVRKGK